MDRITVIRRSLTIFAWAIASLIPLIGVFPAIFALVGSVRISRGYHDWNPAGRYLKLADRLALLGILTSGLTVLLIVFALSRQSASNSHGIFGSGFGD